MWIKNCTHRGLLQENRLDTEIALSKLISDHDFTGRYNCSQTWWWILWNGRLYSLYTQPMCWIYGKQKAVLDKFQLFTVTGIDVLSTISSTILLMGSFMPVKLLFTATFWLGRVPKDQYVTENMFCKHKQLPNLSKISDKKLGHSKTSRQYSIISS